MTDRDRALEAVVAHDLACTTCKPLAGTRCAEGELLVVAALTAIGEAEMKEEA